MIKRTVLLVSVTIALAPLLLAATKPAATPKPAVTAASPAATPTATPAPTPAASPAAAPTKVLNRDGSVGTNIETPVDDLGLKKTEIPPILLAAQENPYDTAGLSQCTQLTTAIDALTVAVGDDIDLPRAESGMSVAGVVDYAEWMFIPFRDVIREVSGARSHKSRVQDAVHAGVARRAFLKGIGQERRCAYPARSATPQVIAARASAIAAAFEAACGNFEQQSRREQYLNRRKCMNYKRATAQATSASAKPGTR